MTVSDLLSADAVIDRIDDFFGGVFAPLDDWVPRLSAQLAACKRPLTGAQLVTLTQPDAHALLDNTDRPLYGAGFCASEGIVTVGNPLAWWQGPDRALLASSTFGPGNAAIDLQRLEWFRVPAETGSRHVAGPFVDYLCSNEITLTASLPVTIKSEFVGVACADVLVTALEDVLLPLVERLGGATMVNSRGRVILSSSEYDTGDLIRGAEEGAETLSDVRVVRSQRFPFALLLPRHAD
ncbi:PDC sensor domain-containing protein [Agrococcus casei]|uniref:PDC sensor domain-containing protein n=1 Tax=Agrococcus casei TaxID=343512 RepID=UPI003F926F90